MEDGIVEDDFFDGGIVKENKTTINHSTIIDGKIKAKEHLVINGTINGNVEIKGFKLFLGPSGRLEGEVHANDVRIRGHMKGDIKATGIVQITKEANYSGKIESKGISVEQGAYFDAFVELGGGSAGTQAQKGMGSIRDDSERGNND
jgi:cytoskeletal protein CcmA (bactofilin family)